MPAESRRWLAYAQENRHVAALSLESGLFNPCLQNAQQATEKALKALCLASGLPLKKTHSIAELRGDLLQAQADPGLSADDADLLDTIYLPSKCPLGSVLPHFEPDAETARRCLTVAGRVLAEAAKDSHQSDLRRRDR
jgi:HEPN domain-containing protein